MIIYETERLFVAPFEEEDLHDYYYNSWFYDEDVTAHNSHGLFPYTEKQKEQFMESIDNGERIVWKVCAIEKRKVLPRHINMKTDNTERQIKVTNTWIGNISLQSFNWINRSAEFAIVLGNKDYWGKGYAVESLKLLIDHGFNKLNLNRIWTGTASTNTGMQKVASKLGMEMEGVSREGMFLNGEYVDIFHYGILRKE
jgi:RimJ/RimL family protein N-acetyltransferase